jgi:hypothetical protein
MIDAMVRLERSLKPYIDKLKVSNCAIASREVSGNQIIF